MLVSDDYLRVTHLLYLVLLHKIVLKHLLNLICIQPVGRFGFLLLAPVSLPKVDLTKVIGAFWEMQYCCKGRMCLCVCPPHTPRKFKTVYGMTEEV